MADAEDEIGDRALVLSGRTATLAEVAEKASELSEWPDPLEAWRELCRWLEVKGAEANAEVDQVRKAIGMASEFH